MSDKLDRNEYREYRGNRKPSDPYFPAGTVHEDVFTVLGSRLFVWDRPKNDVNKQIHGIDFYTAIHVFNDEDRLEDENQNVDFEARMQVVGEPKEPVAGEQPIDTKHSKPKAIIGEVEGVLFVVFAITDEQGLTLTRIISARAADEDEVKLYFDWKYGEQ